MAEATSSNPVGSKVAGWLKAAVTAVFGLASGAALMYVTPLVDRVIKPAKPVANFSVDAKGLQVTFQNRSSGGSEGWWDFGDGSALEPFAADQPAMSHSYPRPGQYTAKLTLRNLVGEENERAASVGIDSPGGGPLEIAALEAVPLQPEAYAPATFRVAGKVNNADLCVWACGGDQPLEVQADPPASVERYVTFKHPGNYTIKLAAVQGHQVIERSAVVQVKAPSATTTMAMLNITSEAMRVEKKDAHPHVKIAFPPNQQGQTYDFNVSVPVRPGCVVTSAKLAQPAPEALIKGAKVTVSPDGTKVTVSGQMVKAGGPLNRNAPPPLWIPELQLSEERRESPCSRPAEAVSVPLQVPGTTFLPLPPAQAGWVMKNRRIALDLYEGAQLVRQNTPVPADGAVVLHNQTWRLTATPTGNGVQINVSALPQAGRPAGN